MSPGESSFTCSTHGRSPKSNAIGPAAPGSACTSRRPTRPGSTRPGGGFGYLTAQKIRRGVHKSVQALEADIRAWIETWNQNPRPFKWTKTADQILDSLAKYIAKISGAGH